VTALAEAASIWKPPVGWVQVASGVWTPPDYKPNDWEAETPMVRTQQEAYVEHVRCRASISYFVMRYCWTTDVDDPTGQGLRKFPTFEYLRRFFKSVQEPSNVHVEKSRQMIMSWAWMAVVLHDILFQDRWTDLVISKRAKDVDDGGAESTIDSNFGKLRFMHAHLPPHLWEPFEYKKFMVRNPKRQSHVKGETGKGSAASRGPTYKRGLMDEAAYVERSETVFKGLRQAAKQGTILNSTPNGKGNVFARIRFSPTTTFKKLRFHWSEHPLKSRGLYCECGWQSKEGAGLSLVEQFNQHPCGNLALNPPRSPRMRSPWYDEQAQDMRPEDIASELDVSYEGSRRGAVFTGFDQTRNVWVSGVGPRRLHESLEAYRARYLRIAISPHLPLVVGWDFGVGDPAVMLLGQVLDEQQAKIRWLDEIEATDKSFDFYGNIVRDVWGPIAWSVGNEIAIRHYGGQDVRNRDSKLESWYSNLRLQFGITVEHREFGQMLEWIDFINDLFRGGVTEISDWCAGLIDAVQNYHYPVDKDTGDPLPGKQLPVHDEWSHKNDAMRMVYKTRFASKLHNRAARAVPTKRLLARGKAYDRRTEHRIF